MAGSFCDIQAFFHCWGGLSESVASLGVSLEFDLILVLGEDRHLGPDLVLVDVHVAPVGHVELAVLALQNRHVLRVVLQGLKTILASRHRDAVLYFLLQVLVPHLQLVLLPLLVVYLQSKRLLLPGLSCKILC